MSPGVQVRGRWHLPRSQPRRPALHPHAGVAAPARRHRLIWPTPLGRV